MAGHIRYQRDSEQSAKASANENVLGVAGQAVSTSGKCHADHAYFVGLAAIV